MWMRGIGSRAARAIFLHAQPPAGLVMWPMAAILLLVVACGPSPEATTTAQSMNTRPAPMATGRLTNEPNVSVQETLSHTPTEIASPTRPATAVIVATATDHAPAPTATPALPVGPVIGALAPDFALFGLAGSTVSLDDLRGKYVVLNFWATWCGLCRAEMPELQAIAEQYAERGVVVLAINYGETEDEVARFAADHGLTFAMGLDSDGAVTRRYQVRTIPTSLVIDEEGVVVARFQGRVTAEAIVLHVTS
jgi:peroxiredoxin